MKLFVIASVVGITVITACAKDETVPPATAPNQQGQYPQGQYPQQPPPQGQYPQQPPQGQYPQQPPPQGQYPQQPPAGAAMATPGPLALPCQNDQGCGIGKCNMQFQKCAFPCANSQADCATGASCNTITGLCLPAMPGQP